jgi:WD40 repeat protein
MTAHDAERVHLTRTRSLAVLPNGHLASGSHGNTVCVWDVRSGSCALTLSGHTNWVPAARRSSRRSVLAIGRGAVVARW